jgi:hypothetical protein
MNQDESVEVNGQTLTVDKYCISIESVDRDGRLEDLVSLKALASDRYGNRYWVLHEDNVLKAYCFKNRSGRVVFKNVICPTCGIDFEPKASAWESQDGKVCLVCPHGCRFCYGIEDFIEMSNSN